MADLEPKSAKTQYGHMNMNCLNNAQNENITFKGKYRKENVTIKYFQELKSNIYNNINLLFV